MKFLGNAPLWLRRSPLLALGVLVASAGLSACGGGGGGETAPLATSAILQGRWSSNGISPAYTVVTVPTSSGANVPAVDTLWGLAQDGSVLLKLKANGAADAAGTVTGQRFSLGSAETTAVNAGNYSLSSNTDTQLTLQSALGSTVTFSRSDAMASPLRADQANGKWLAALGSIQVTWAVQSAGSASNISGSSTSGCSYSGTTSLVDSQSLYKVQFNENCSGTVRSFSGIATMSPGDSRLTVVAANADESRGVALLFERQP